MKQSHYNELMKIAADLETEGDGAIAKSLRAALAALPSDAGAPEPVAVIGSDWQLFYAGCGPIAPIVEKHGLKIGSKLYAAPVVDSQRSPDNAELQQAYETGYRHALSPGAYQASMGEAAQKYFETFKHAHPLPAQFRWSDVYDAMTRATVAPDAAAPSDEPLPCDFCDAKTMDPWHTSDATRRHLHQCDACHAAAQPDERAAIPLAWQSTFDGLLAYVLQDDLHNRLTPRLIDIAYTAFMSGASGKNKEDGGPCDWFNDTKPVVQAAIEEIRKKLDEARATSQATAFDPTAECNPFVTACPRCKNPHNACDRAATPQPLNTDDAIDACFRRNLGLRVRNLTVSADGEITWIVVECRGKVSSLEVRKSPQKSEEQP